MKQQETQLLKPKFLLFSKLQIVGDIERVADVKIYAVDFLNVPTELY